MEGVHLELPFHISMISDCNLCNVHLEFYWKQKDSSILLDCSNYDAVSFEFYFSYAIKAATVSNDTSW